MKKFISITVLISILLLSACVSEDGTLVAGGQDPDPVVIDLPIAYVKRPLPVEDDGNGNIQPVLVNLREPISFLPGASLFFRNRASATSEEINLTDGIFEIGSLYDVKDVDTSYDGTKLVFAMRAPEIEDADEDEQPKWDIWEYDNTTKEVTRLITSDIVADEGEDISPHYLPDGRIVFTSTRQRLAKAILLDEGKPQYDAFDEDQNVRTLALHVMNGDGTNITQITFNQSHDLTPSVLTNGKIVFSRWDNVNRNDEISLYQVNPDGSNLEFLYGFHSHETGTDGSVIEFMQPRQAPDGRIIVKLRPNLSPKFGGEIVYIDWQNFTENEQTAISSNGATGPAQVTATPFDVRTDDNPSAGGRFANVYPLFDGSGRFLVSWSPCRLSEIDTNGIVTIVPCTEEALADDSSVEANPLYGIWSFNPEDGTQIPVVVGVEGIITHEVVAMAPRDIATVIPDIVLNADQTLISEGVGILHIESVYDFDGVDTSPAGIATLADPVQTEAAMRPARFIRIVKAVSLPSEDLVDIPNTAFGRSNRQLMRDILGYAIVEPDGSAMFKVPANTAFAISVLDANGRRISERHQNWMTLKAGEIKECHGCHTNESELPHGRYDAEANSINLGAPVTGNPFPNTTATLFANQGETMAEVYNRINGFQPLSVNIKYTDYWNDPALSAVNPDIDFSYSALQSQAPTDPGCQGNWSALCRVSINYVDEIQPIWEVSRQVLDDMGNLVVDNTCISCHNVVDDMGVAKVPDAQLELLGGTSVDEPDHVISYRELFFGDNAVELVNGALIDLLVPVFDANGNQVFEVDADGNLILDANGDPIPVMQTVPMGALMRTSGANNNNGFLDLFAVGASHEGRLSGAELKLISEWLDIGAQYYNNPFDVPQN